MSRHWQLLVLFVVWIRNVSSEVSFPDKVSAAEGQDVMFRFQDPISNMVACAVRSPATADLVTYILWGPGATTGGRIQYWGDGSTTCGARIQNVTSKDAGMWTQTVTRDTGNNEIHETKAIFQLTVITVNVTANLNQEVVSGSSLVLTIGKMADEYCEMLRPTGESPSQTFTGGCTTTLDDATGADSGKWSALVGVAGLTEEVLVEGRVNVYDVIPTVGFSDSLVVTGGINLFCNFPHHNFLYFCRFVRPDGTGFRMNEGIGNGKYSYYGSGLKNGECGLTIEGPQDIDYGTWKCMVKLGTDDTNDNPNTMESSIYVTKQNEDVIRSPIETHTSLLLGSAAMVQCTAPSALQYCTILSPAGVEHTGSASLLSQGACALALTEVSAEHNGTWECQMGRLQGGFETRALLNVHVTESPLVAINQEITSILGQQALLLCQTIAFLNNASLTDAMKRPAIKYCRFIRPDGAGFAVEEDTESGGRYQYYGTGFARGECGLNISRVSVEDRGLWKCAVKLDLVENVAMEFSDTVRLSASGSGIVFPSWLSVQQGDDVILQMTQTLDNQSRCSVRFPDGTVVDLSTDTNPVVSYWGAGVTLRSCGVRINTQLVNVTSGGYEEWALISEDEQGNKKEGSSWVAVDITPTARHKGVSTVVAELGGALDVNCSRGHLDGGGYCIVLPPSSESSHFVPGPCFKHVDPVTQADFGDWKCITGEPETMVESVETISVISNESPLSVQWRRVDQSTGVIVCNIDKPLDFCRFVAPDGTGLRVGNGLARDRFSYSGGGLETGDCGLRITKLSAADYGSWKCFVGFAQGIRIGYITITKTKDVAFDLESAAKNKRAVAVSGSRLIIQCRANATLSYCWLRHPNGTSFTPALGDCTADSASCYKGAGLDMGECGMVVEQSTRGDSGLWSCHMGVVDGGELVTKVEAYVAATSLMAEVREIEAFRGSAVTLNCNSVPPGSALEYCRFVRADGIGFHPDPVSKEDPEGMYAYSGSSLLEGHCGLLIKQVTGADEGVWTCAARIRGETMEARDTLELRVHVLSSASIGGITVGSILLVAVLVIFSVWYYKQPRGQRLSTTGSVSSSGSSEDIVLQVIQRPASHEVLSPAGLASDRL